VKITMWRGLGVVFFALCVVLLNNAVYKQKHPGYGVNLAPTVTPYPIDTSIFTSLALESQKLPDKNFQVWYTTMGELDHALIVYSAGRQVSNENVSEDFFYAHEGFKTATVESSMNDIYEKTGQLFESMDAAMRKASSKQEWLQERVHYLQLCAEIYDLIRARY